MSSQQTYTLIMQYSAHMTGFKMQYMDQNSVSLSTLMSDSIIAANFSRQWKIKPENMTFYGSNSMCNEVELSLYLAGPPWALTCVNRCFNTPWLCCVIRQSFRTILKSILWIFTVQSCITEYLKKVKTETKNVHTYTVGNTLALVPKGINRLWLKHKNRLNQADLMMASYSSTSV